MCVWEKTLISPSFIYLDIFNFFSVWDFQDHIDFPLAAFLGSGIQMSDDRTFRNDYPAK